MNDRASVVLMYHRIGCPLNRSIVRGQYVLPSSLRRQLATLASHGYTPMRLAEMLQHRTGRFSITFDDGYSSVRRLAYPILVEMQALPTIFVAAGGVGKTNEWDVQIGDRTEKMLTLSELREMASTGAEIGSHTMSHAHLTELSDHGLHGELVDSKHALEDMLGVTVVGFAYPYGEWDARVRDAVVQAGYQYAVIATRGTIGPDTDMFAIPRVNMRWATVGRRLIRKIGGNG